MKKENANTQEAPKVALASRASVLDLIILAGGTFEELTEKADAAAAPLKTKIKHYTPALFKTHMRYRESNKPGFFSGVEITDKGIFPKTKK